MAAVCRKGELAKNISALAALAPQLFAFAPVSFCLPDDLNLLKERLRTMRDSSNRDNTFFIVKPVKGSQGKGISLCHPQLGAITRAAQEAADDVGARGAREVVVSEYIPNPLCIHGRKFDLRLVSRVEHSYNINTSHLRANAHHPPTRQPLASTCEWTRSSR